MVLDGDYFQAEPTTPDVPNTWIIRPCEWYKDEYKECRKLRSRVHQFFIFGETLDCKTWNEDYYACLEWRKNRNKDALEFVVEKENKRYLDRMNASSKNNVWEYRSCPPKDWNKPLPEYHTKDHKGSVLEEYQIQREKDTFLRNKFMQQNGSK